MTTLILRRPLSFRPSLFTFVTAALVCSSAGIGRAQVVDWTRQFGTTGDDRSYGVSADGLDAVYTVGTTTGNLGGPNAGGIDAYISKFDSTGATLWVRQLGSSGDDESRAVSADSLGNVYLSGFTLGSLGGPNAGKNDAFVSKYAADGSIQWTNQLGTSSHDRSWGVSADGLGSVYISGTTGGSLGGPSAGSEDAFIRKYADDGTVLWTRQLGASGSDGSYGVSADGLGNVFITGYTTGSLNGPNSGGVDSFVAKYDSTGAVLWTRQQGTSGLDYGLGVSADAVGNVYVAGVTAGSLGGPNAGAEDAFLTKYDASGNLQWTRQLGSLAADVGYGVSADELGFVYIGGTTAGSLAGPFGGGSADAFVGKYDADGNVVWTYQLGDDGDEEGYGVSADGLGSVYLTGGAMAAMGAAAVLNGGGHDPEICVYNPILVKLIPEPASFMLALVGVAGIAAMRFRRHKA
jgi:hypothetical protein